METNYIEGWQRATARSAPASESSENSSVLTPSSCSTGKDSHPSDDDTTDTTESSDFDDDDPMATCYDITNKYHAPRAGRYSTRATPPLYTDPLSGLAAVVEHTVKEVLGGVTELPRYIADADERGDNKGSSARHDRPENAGFAFARGLVRIMTAGIIAPRNYTTALAVGFNNVPKLYGDETSRKDVTIASLEMGVAAAGQGLALGLYDGISGFFVQPVKGAQKNGIKGFGKGFGRGLGGLICKPIAGACGVPAYLLQGVHAEVDKHLV